MRQLKKIEVIKPAFYRISPVNINGIGTHRLMIVFKTKGCEYARKTGGCTVCGFKNNAREDIRDEEIISQLDFCIETILTSDVQEIDLLTLGSFFNDNEVSPYVRTILLEKMSHLKAVKRVSIESRAEYVTYEKLKQCKQILKDKILEYAIGLESADDYVRNEIIKKDLSKEVFEETVARVKRSGCDLLVYLLVNPPRMSEKKAIEDAVASARYVFNVADKHRVLVRVAFEPVFICENTQLEDLYFQAQYKLVNLWSVVEVVRQTHSYGNIFVGLSDENLSLERLPQSCSQCGGTIAREIERFNKTQDISGLEKLQCQCKKDYLYKLEKGLI